MIDFLLLYWDWMLVAVIAVGWRIEIWHERQRADEDAAADRCRRNLWRVMR